jgi:hypothetical protein
MIRDILVFAREGRTVGIPVKAQQLVCQCGGEFFIIFTIDGHQHAQCSDCGETQCDGSCADRPRLEGLT